MKRFTKFRRFMPGSPLWLAEQERIAAEKMAADELAEAEAAKKPAKKPAKKSKKSPKK
tara:strand:+ start:398 stop:571 length:174 start_codon:yes stop_codon:yes gene_type:complete